LAAAAARRGHTVKLTRRGRYAKLGYVVTEKKQWSLELHEEHDEVPRTPPRGRARAWQSWGYAPTDKVPSGRLRLIVCAGPGDPDKAGRWSDDKRGTLEKRIPSIVRDLQARHEEQVRAHEEWRREWEREQAEQARRRAAEKIEWEAAIAHARPQAIDALRQATLLAALGAWRDAQDMREICSVLGQAADNARAAGQEELAANLLAWQEGGLALADTVDPTRGSASFAHLPFALEPTADDLRPFLDGWNPRTPGRDYYTGPREHKPSKPWPDAWEQFRH
jgi:hypothetical protein